MNRKSSGAEPVFPCQTPQQQTDTLAGGAIGAGTGALIGDSVTRPWRHCARWGFDGFGKRVCVAFYRW